MKIIKAVKGRKALKGNYVVTVLVNESELNELAHEERSEMKMAAYPTLSLEDEAIKWIEAASALKSSDVIKITAV